MFGEYARIAGTDVVIDSSVNGTLAFADAEDKWYVTSMYSVAAMLGGIMAGVDFTDMNQDIHVNLPDGLTRVMFRKRGDVTPPLTVNTENEQMAWNKVSELMYVGDLEFTHHRYGFSITYLDGSGCIKSTYDRHSHTRSLNFVPGMTVAEAAEQLESHRMYPIPVSMFGSTIELTIGTQGTDKDIYLAVVMVCAELVGVELASESEEDWFIGLDVDVDDLGPTLVQTIIHSNWKSGDVRAVALKLDITDFDVLMIVVPMAIQEANGSTPHQMYVSGELADMYARGVVLRINSYAQSVLEVMPPSMRTKYHKNKTLAALRFLGHACDIKY